MTSLMIQKLRRLGRRASSFRASGSAVLLACVGVALALGAVASSASSPLSFARASYFAGESPRSATVGDLNGDGKPDLAIADEDEDSVAVLLNRGDGRCRAQRLFGTGSGPVSVAVGDLNGDRKQDLATANVAGDTVSVLLNNGGGLFGTRRTYATDEGPQSLAIGDLNGDGSADLVTANDTSVSVLLNKGDSSFQRKVDYRLEFNGIGSVAIGDLNADGKPDLAGVPGPAQTVSVFLNRGDESFLPKVDYATGRRPVSVAIGDLNGDEKVDLATANSVVFGQNTVSVLVNRGDGSFLPKVDYATGRETVSIVIGDLNGDRMPDLATANWYHTVSVLLNRGDGSFQSRLDYPSGRRPQSLAAGELNGDGKLDLVTANTGEVNVLLNATGLCAVPLVKGKPLTVARRAIARAGCRVGKVELGYSPTVKTGRVISQKPTPGRVLANGGKVDLVVSRGRKQ
jgi:hypothetical protein